MNLATPAAPLTETARYARCIEASKRIRWDIDADVIRDRRFDPRDTFLPERLSRVSRLDFLPADDRRLLSQVQGRTYANMFGLVERFIGAKILERTREHWFGDQVALEALVRFSDEELKHQALFRRIEALAAAVLPPGYRFDAEPDAVARAVLAASDWAVLALTCHIELFTQAHYRASIDPDAHISPLWKDVFHFHWKEESQHAILDELEWQREDRRLDDAARDHAVGELIALVQAVDGVVAAQATADAEYFAAVCESTLDPGERRRVHAGLLDAYRWQYIGSGLHEPRFRSALAGMLNAAQLQRIAEATAPWMA